MYRILITMVGEARNINCALFVSKLTTIFDFEFCILVGIAAGMKTETKYGDVICPEYVFDYEYQRIEKEKIRKRFEPINLNPFIKIHRNSLFTEKELWLNEVKKVYKEIEKNNKPYPKKINIKARLKKGVLLAGEKLIADKLTRLEKIVITDRFDYTSLQSLSSSQNIGY